MIRIAVTGNIASGKSEVQKILEEKGYKVVDHVLKNKDMNDELKAYINAANVKKKATMTI